MRACVVANYACGKCNIFDLARWSEWQNAPTPCSATCGSGKQSRVRNCDNGSVGAIGCQGDVQDFIECNSNPCRT